jgi:predicted RNase H-like nuclease (RuvC/YqgF family)
MLTVFILILVIGLIGFILVFTKALQGYREQGAGSLRSLDKLAESPVSDLVLSPMRMVDDEAFKAVEVKAVTQAFELKIMKLEQMIDEKNRMITDLQKGLRSGHDHEVQFEDLKQILQAQIEELKQENKKLRSEISRSSEENLDLQTKIYAGQASKGISIQKTEGSVDPLTLHDVFGVEEKIG